MRYWMLPGLGCIMKFLAMELSPLSSNVCVCVSFYCCFIYSLNCWKFWLWSGWGSFCVFPPSWLFAISIPLSLVVLMADAITEGLMVDVLLVRELCSWSDPARFIVWCRIGLLISPSNLPSLELSSFVCAISVDVTCLPIMAFAWVNASRLPPNAVPFWVSSVRFQHIFIYPNAWYCPVH